MARYTVTRTTSLFKGAGSHTIRKLSRGNSLNRVGVSPDGRWIHVRGTLGGYPYDGFVSRLDVKLDPILAIGRLVGKHLVNDVGHGMNNTARGRMDPGACAGKATEYNAVSHFVQALTIAEKRQGASVRISQGLPLRDRRAVAAEDATSWHANAGGGTGVEVLVPMFATRASVAKSDRLGKAIALAAGLRYRGTKRTPRLSVLNRGYDRLVELFFIDDSSDRADFAAHRDAIVAAVLANI